MPFDKSPAELDRLVEEAIQIEDVSKGLLATAYTNEEVHADIAKQRSAVWEVALDEIGQYDSAEAKLAGLTASESEQLGKQPPDPTDLGGPDWMWVVAALALLGAVIWGVVHLIRFPRESLASLLTLEGWIPIGATLLGFFVWLGIAVFIGDSQGNSRKATALEEWKQRRAKWLHDSGIEGLTATIQSQRTKIINLIVERVRQLVRAAINQRLAPSYATIFEIRNPSGFSEVFDKRFTIPTPARERLEFMLKNMPGGSIGIGGSRGAGKTTLLKLFCGPKRVVATLKEKSVLGVLVSAPVAYDARDFILYMFSTVCKNVIAAEGGTPDAPRDTVASSALADSAGPSVISALRRLPALFVCTGLVITILSVLLAAALVAAQPASPSPAESKTSSAVVTGSSTSLSATPAATASPTRASTSAAASALPPGPAASPSAPAGVGTAKTTTKKRAVDGNPTVRQWFDVLKIDPSQPFTVGVVLVAIGFTLATLLQVGWWSRLMEWTRALPFRIQFLFQYRSWLSAADAASFRKTGRFLQTPSTTTPDGNAAVEGSLRAHAETWLRRIKFQQSYTTGWSGALKLPIGLEGGINRAETFAENQMSLPEVVHSLTQFLEEAAAKYQVIVGIDEMDKLAGDTLAQQFLNDIKSIFGLEGCFYLISVSENAISNFERRGLPFRDVFDSSFDDFVYVDYLDFELAQKLLEQRLVGRPIPFFALSFCMSGGLARDLIRSFRYILEVYEKHPSTNSLGFICQRMVNTDLAAKIRAIRTSAQQVRIKRELDELVKLLYVLESGITDDNLMIESALKLLKLGPQWTQTRQSEREREEAARVSRGGGGQHLPAEREDEGEKVEGELERLKDLAEELGSYIQFSLTMREIFNNGVQPQVFETPKEGGSVDVLGKVRQILGVNPGTARTLLGRFRKAHGLKEFAEA